jgi:hypothetical protein
MIITRYSDIGRTSVANPKKSPAMQIDLIERGLKFRSIAFVKYNVATRSKKMKRISLSKVTENKIINGSTA